MVCARLLAARLEFFPPPDYRRDAADRGGGLRPSPADHLFPACALLQHDALEFLFSRPGGFSVPAAPASRRTGAAVSAGLVVRRAGIFFRVPGQTRHLHSAPVSCGGADIRCVVE